jgi:hypothetical protein
VPNVRTDIVETADTPNDALKDSGNTEATGDALCSRGSAE